MDTTTLIIAVVAVLVIVGVFLALSPALSRRKRSNNLRGRFGPEYDHLVETTGDETQAQMELTEREKRVMSLDIHPLSAADREQFLNEWHTIQFDFIDEPGQAVEKADRLVLEVMQDRGYPKSDFEQRVADISVNYPESAAHYRSAQEIAVKNEERHANTEELRQAMVHYRSIFQALLESEEKVKKI
jgi:hypothetical protein